MLVSTYAPDSALIRTDLPPGILLHIGSSILAYAVLTLAAAQAALLAAQDHQLKHRHTRGLVQILPPLQLMETMLFELLWWEILLSVAIVSGFFFLDDILPSTWCIKPCSRWAPGYCSRCCYGPLPPGLAQQNRSAPDPGGIRLLVLAYFGTKLVLELVLIGPELGCEKPCPAPVFLQDRRQRIVKVHT